MTTRIAAAVLVVLAAAACSPAPSSPAAPAQRQQALLTPILSETFEGGLGSWTAATTSGVGTWHVVTHPETISMPSALNPFCVTLADTGAHLAAAGGTNVAWFGNDVTGSFIGSNYGAQTAKNGGTSPAVQTGTLTSPSLSLVGSTRAQLEFDSWWEIEGTAAASYDLSQVWVSNNGAAFVLLGQLNPSFAAVQPSYAAYSSGGPSAPPVWRHYAWDLSAYAGTTNLRIQFRFDSRDASFNAFRGFTVDNVVVSGGPSLNAPTLTGVSPNVATLNDLVTMTGTNFIQGAVFSIGTTPITAGAITQFGASEVIFKVPALTAGSYSIKVTNPDGQTFTLPNAFTYSSASSPKVTAISPSTVNVATAQSVTISGSNFVSGATVFFGDTAASDVVVATATSLTATAPALSSGTWNVTVTNPSGQGGTKFAAYTVSDTSTMALTSPVGGESWAAGSTHDLTWTSSGTAVVSADLYKGGVFVANIAASVPASPGTFAWTIPAGTAAGADYKVKLFNPLGTSSTTSPASFGITSSIPTSTALASSANPSSAGEAVTFTATISPVVTGGTVQFSIDGVAFGAPVAVVGSAATSTATATLSGGPHAVSAAWSGAGSFLGSSASLTQNVNRSPVATPQALSTDENTSTALVLGATDADADPLTWSIVSGPAHGALSGAPPNLGYTPAPGYSGADAITFKVNDGRVDSNVATVSITVIDTNVAPVAANQSTTGAEDTALALSLAATDADGDALSWSIVTPPAHGTLSGVAPNLSYQPTANYFGPDSFTFKVNDGALDSNVATVSVSVSSVNDAPLAAGQALGTAEDTSMAVVLGAADPEGDALTWNLVTPPAHGTLSGVAPDLSYQPAANYFGPDSFTFQVNDGALDSNVATVSVSVTGVDDAPVAAAQSLTTAEDVSLALTLSGTDVEGAPLAFAVVSQPAHGTLSGAPPNLSYQPAADYHGADTFTFKANDGALDSSVETISFTVTAVNDAPIAAAQSLTGAEDSALPLTLGASDVDGDALTWTLVTPPTHGTLSGTAPNLSYQPAADFNGPDSFIFKVNDGALDSNVATVSVSISSVNDAPVATSQALATAEDSPGAVALSATDLEGDALSWSIVTPPAHGTLSGVAPNLSYEPTANYFGPDGFTFKVNDGTLDSNVATVSVSVSSVNDAPLAAGQALGTAEDTSMAVVLGAADPEGDALSWSIVTPPAHGTLSGVAPDLSYQPAANYFGPDSFTFRVNDGALDSNVATVSVSVSGVDDAPVAAAQSLTTAEDVSLALTLSGTDVEGAPLAFAVVSQPAHGTLSGAPPNLSYQPAADYHGADSFTFKANDGALDSSVETISFTVTAVNDAPTAAAQSLTGAEDSAVPMTLTASDVDGDALTWTIVAPPTHGTLSGTAPNLSYQPAADFNGADSFTFTVNDGALDSNVATVSLSVSSVNDAPVAISQALSTAEDVALPVTLSGTDTDLNTLTFQVIDAPLHGTLTGTSANVIYVPASDYHGPDAFSFVVDDGTIASVPATISVTVGAVNDAPSAVSASLVVDEDGSATITLAGNDVDGDPLTYRLVTQPTHGALTGSAPAFTYAPVADANGTDSFTFVANDGTLDSAPAIVTITITPVNDPPLATPAQVSAEEDENTAITLAGTDVDVEPLTFTVDSQPQHGTLSGTAPHLVYVPAANYVGPDGFTFHASDAVSDSAAASISIEVGPINDAPVAAAQTLATDEDAALTVTLAGSDEEGTPLTFTVVAPPAHGQLSGAGAERTYLPGPDFHGTDEFTFVANDGQVDSAVATISVTIRPVNDAPVASPLSVSTPEDTGADLTLSGTDVDGDDLSFVVTTPPAHGVLQGAGSQLRYTPAAGFHGADSFSFRATDGVLESADALVAVQVGSVNDAPVAEATALTTGEDTALAIALVASDPDGDALSWTLVTPPAHGVLSGTAPDLVYTPEANFFGADSFTFRVNDGLTDSNVATAAISVTAVDDRPVAERLSVTLLQSTSTEIALRGADVEAAELTFTISGAPLHGTLSGTPPTLVYKPFPAYAGDDAFTYTVSAEGVESETSEVSITVVPANDTLTGGGVGCSSTSQSTPWVLLALLIGAQIARRVRRGAAGVAAVALTVSVGAQAQTVMPVLDVESLRLNPGASQSLATETGALMAPQTLRLAVTAHYQYEPLVLFRDGARVGALVKGRFTTHFGVAWTPLPWLEVAAQLPVVLGQHSDDLSGSGYARPAQVALGTALLQGRVGLLQQRSGAPIDLVLSLGVDLPVGSASALSVEAGPGALPRLGVGRALMPWLRVGAEAGVMLRPPTTLGSSTGGRTALMGAVLVETLGSGLRGELSWHAAVPLAGGAVGSELLLGGRYPLTANLELYALGGVGLGRGLGTPAFRAAVGVALAIPTVPAAASRCGPGLASEPEQCPALDWDGDGVMNGVDACPKEAGPEGGCLRTAPPAEVVVAQPAPVEAAVLAPDPIALELALADLLERVPMFTRTGAELLPSALPVLDQAAALLLSHPEFARFQVRGHTDPAGDARANDALSMARAQAVRAYLVEKGLAPASLTAAGFGSRHLIAPGDTEADRELNRRVEIRVGTQN